MVSSDKRTGTDCLVGNVSYRMQRILQERKDAMQFFRDTMKENKQLLNQMKVEMATMDIRMRSFKREMSNIHNGVKRTRYFSNRLSDILSPHAEN